MVHISEKDILYRPNLRPDRDYSSEAEIPRGIEQDPGEAESMETISSIIEEMEDVISKADQLSNILYVGNPVFKNIKDNLNYISNNIFKMKGFETTSSLLNKEIDDEDIPERSQEEKDLLISIYGLVPDTLKVIGEKDITKYIDSSKNMDILKVYDNYIDSISKVFNDFYREALRALVDSNFQSIEEIIDYKVGEIDKEKEGYSNIEPIVHKMDMAKILIDQKSKMIEKVFNINKTVKYIITINATNELRKKYYSIKPVI